MRVRGKSPLPTGTAVLTHQEDWRRFALSDCGCGMRLLRSGISPGDLDLRRWNQVANLLRANKGSLGDLGGGNHFLDALAPYDDGPLYFLIHTGSRNESGHVDVLIDQPAVFDRTFDQVVQWAADNRATIQERIERAFGKTGSCPRPPSQYIRATRRWQRHHPQRFRAPSAWRAVRTPIAYVRRRGAGQKAHPK